MPAVLSVDMCTTKLAGCGPISNEVPPDWDERAFRLASRTLEYLWLRIACQYSKRSVVLKVMELYNLAIMYAVTIDTKVFGSVV